jgi:hypothetical protein
MLFRRFAVAIALLVAGLFSQAPEFVQQYAQRLGGAIDELRAAVARFDQEAANQSLSRQQGIARLEANADPLAQNQGHDMEGTVARLDRLERQREALAVAGPVSRYVVVLDGFDRQVAAGTYRDFAPALPVTTAGLLAAVFGFVMSWLLMHGVVQPFRRRQWRRGVTDLREA